ncbi:MAG: pyruvate dehydrogenase complex dihydrolipoamide acetyltransferase [Rhizobiales bacterium 62-17]|nr:pyruvate dehydrogenase complex dihydrolipoamide acetyltransferase [Hyphomicrobiales bacterium]OJY04471.1 MAG: pyruvate dehydrogenase complex dihydrolipoamide acetyltransferase [Rhizobiales bacterium 62-17]
MPINILMPALSPTMEKGNLARWVKKEGDKIKSGDVIAEIETDKATMEVEAIDEGVIAKILVPEGTQDVPVNQLIAIVAGEGEDAKAVAASGGAAAPAPKAAAPAPAAAPEAPMAQPAAAPAAAPAPAAPAPAPAAKPAGEKVFASPLAKRLAKEAGLDLASIAGTGPHGRIVERDVKAAQAGGGAKVAPAAAKPGAPVLAPGMSDETIKKMYAPGSFEEVPHDSMRKIIARRLVEAKQTIPHFYLSVDCNLTALLAAREAINAAAPKNKEKQPLYKVSVNDFVIKALGMALQRVPEANVTYTENTMLKHTTSDIGVAVSIPGGLITPVVRNVQTKGLAAISNEMKDYAARARARKLKPEEYQGGTSAVSNLGMFGIKNFSAVINPPHATILAVGTGEERVIVEKGQMKVATMMSVTLSTDHRAVDGALGAELISAFKDLIENPVSMLV